MLVGERCWIAEREGENVGSVLLMRETQDIARLRLLLVEPKARGLGMRLAEVRRALFLEVGGGGTAMPRNRWQAYRQTSSRARARHATAGIGP
jgi:hypothetical protein